MTCSCALKPNIEGKWWRIAGICILHIMQNVLHIYAHIYTFIRFAYICTYAYGPTQLIIITPFEFFPCSRLGTSGPWTPFRLFGFIPKTHCRLLGRLLAPQQDVSLLVLQFNNPFVSLTQHLLALQPSSFRATSHRKVDTLFYYKNGLSTDTWNLDCPQESDARLVIIRCYFT